MAATKPPDDWHRMCRKYSQTAAMTVLISYCSVLNLSPACFSLDSSLPNIATRDQNSAGKIHVRLTVTEAEKKAYKPALRRWWRVAVRPSPLLSFVSMKVEKRSPRRPAGRGEGGGGDGAVVVAVVVASATMGVTVTMAITWQ